MRLGLLASLAIVLAVPATPALAQSLKVFTDTKDLGYEISLPAGCRHDIKPGTIEAICSPDLDASKARGLKAAGAWLFELDGEIAPADAAAYTLDTLKAEIPDMVCGQDDTVGMRLDKVVATNAQGRQMFNADVTCPGMPILNLPARKASVVVIIAGQKRFRLLARTPADDSSLAAPLVDAVFNSFKLKD